MRKNKWDTISVLCIDCPATVLTEMKRLIKKLWVAEDFISGFRLLRKHLPSIVIYPSQNHKLRGLELAFLIHNKFNSTEHIAIVKRQKPEHLEELSDLGSRILFDPVKKRKLWNAMEACLETLQLRQNIEEQTTYIKKLSFALEQSPSAVIITDTQGFIEYVNPKFSQQTGYGKDEILGTNISILKSSKSGQRSYKTLWSALENGKEWHGELLNRKKDGKFYWVSTSISPVKNDNGEVTNYVAVEEDITARKRVEKALRTNQKHLRIRNEMIVQDLNNARLIQKALLPRVLPEISELKIDFRYLPLESVGGDFFSFTQLQEGGLGVFLGDVTGHGVSAALFLALVKALTDRACRRYGKKPKEYFNMLNRDLINNMTTNFLTAVYGVFHFNHGSNYATFTFSKGGHPPPIIYRSKSKSVELANIGGTLLGFLPETEYEENTILFEKGDRIFLYTDGIEETMDPEDNSFGIQRLCDKIQKTGKIGLSQALDSIIRGVNRHRKSSSIKDDIVLLGFEIR